MKLNNLIIISFIVTGFIVSLIGGFLYYYYSQNNLVDQVSNSLLAISESRAEHINTYFLGDIDKEKLIASRTQLRKDIFNYLVSPTPELYAELTRKFMDSKGAIEDIECVCFINLEGKVIACDDELLVGKDYSKENFFTKGKEKEGVYFFNIDGNLRIMTSGPIIQDGKLKGVMFITETLDELEAIVKDRTGLGDTGEVLVAFIDDKGDYVYPFKGLFESSSISPGEPMKQALFGNELIFKNVLDYRNVPVIASSQYIDIVDLGLVAKIDISEIKSSQIVQFLRALVFIGVIIILVSFVFGFFLSQRIGKPISQLQQATKEIQEKNFKARVNIKSGDEFQELGDSFNRTAEVLENLDKEKNQIDKAKTEFLSITSHELRSPMTPMKAQLQMVLGDYFGKLTKEQRESLNIVLNNTERLDKIIVDFLEISRIEAARLKFVFVKADLNKTIESVVDEMKGFMPEKKIKIETHVEKLPIIECDPDRVGQVLRNLLSNAIKFTPDNGKVEVSTKLYHGMILFSVKDNGIGIAEKDQRKLFEPFYQVENMYQHKSGGTGLGLAISRGIVESQNGKIWLNSQPGKGTIFYFTVPLKPVREIKAIRLLFSDTEKYDEEIKNIFKEYIGPLGDKEFENLKESNGITMESIREYISDLSKKGIIQNVTGEEFKNKISLILNKGEVKEKVGLSDLAGSGLISERKEVSKITNKDLKEKLLRKL